MSPNHFANREGIFSALRKELVGPDPTGKELDCQGEIRFQFADDVFAPYRQAGSGDEILQRDTPCKRYGIAVLYPIQTPAESGDEQSPGDSGPDKSRVDETPLTETGVKGLEELDRRSSRRRREDPDQDDFELSSANTYRPSSMGVSFLAEVPAGASIAVKVSGGRYRKKKVLAGDRERIWWLRNEIRIAATFYGDSLIAEGNVRAVPSVVDNQGLDGIEIAIELFSRPHGRDRRTRLITACLINRNHAERAPDEHCLFQVAFDVTVIADDNGPHILPYPATPHERLDPEEKSLALLYRNCETFAVGHGCAADWKPTNGSRKVELVSAVCLPKYEAPSITPQIRRADGSEVSVSMAKLAGLIPGDDGFAALQEIIDLYAAWILQKKGKIPALNPDDHEAANQHMADCELAIERMRQGFAYLKSTPDAAKAFQLANHAILLQQIRSLPGSRRSRYSSTLRAFEFTALYSVPDPLSPPSGRGNWRPFQAAFLLMSVRSVADERVPDRKTVELIWFPTGGGKTEAYLGLSAFSIFMRRLRNSNDAGTSVLMRYTLRLLTAQQFQRASGLICAMEHLRRAHRELGDSEISIGIWLGSSVTPNNHQEAKQILKELQGAHKNSENKFLIDRCPWCRAQLGPVDGADRLSRNVPKVLGYEQIGDRVGFRCPDSACEFREGLPVYVVDDDLYEKRPSLVIGTVDKFAMLAWRPEARALFGIDAAGNRVLSPPGLIIQDELHLISGPLGSMVGLYEAIIEDLCTDHRGESAASPKIICSTATIRRYSEQVRALYGREHVKLFPPPGLTVDDSFFARYARDASGDLLHGQIYVGVHAPGLGSLQTAQVRTFTALLQAPVPLDNPARDPWWTLMMFFNSLRELGTTLSLFQSDIPDYFKVVRNRLGIPFSGLRRLSHPLELTGRLRNDEVPKAISALEATCGGASGQPIDFCLASSIIEVGIDIDRLSLLSIVGQPKTTSQYIQVSGRVGRRWWERPGMVVTIYVASKPRDRSHFEKFRSYHERLYAQVEPTSVTPFSRPALERALHAIMAAYVRQGGSPGVAASPHPFPEALIGRLRQLMDDRVASVDSEEQATLRTIFDKRIDEWRRWGRHRWQGATIDGDAPLLYQAGGYVTPEHKMVSWATPMSMRNVDATCEVEITQLYAIEEQNSSG